MAVEPREAESIAAVVQNCSDFPPGASVLTWNII